MDDAPPFPPGTYFGGEFQKQLIWTAVVMRCMLKALGF